MNHSDSHDENCIAVSVVIPCFQSPIALVQLVEETRASLQGSQHVSSFEVILVADGADSYRNLRKIFPEVPHSVRMVQLTHNYGEQIALIAGVMEATKEYVCTLDDDGQHPASVIEILLEEKLRSGANLVYGQDSGVSQPFAKHGLSRLFKKFLETLLARGASKISSVRLFERTRITDALEGVSDRAVVLDGVLLQVFDSVSSTAVDFRPRSQGRSGYNLRSLATHALNLAMSAAQKPLRALLWLGVMTLAAGIATGLIVAYDAIFLLDLFPPWGLLIAVALSIVGLQLFSIAIVGELVSRVLSEIRGYKLFEVTKRDPSGG